MDRLVYTVHKHNQWQEKSVSRHAVALLCTACPSMNQSSHSLLFYLLFIVAVVFFSFHCRRPFWSLCFIFCCWCHSLVHRNKLSRNDPFGLCAVDLYRSIESTYKYVLYNVLYINNLRTTDVCLTLSDFSRTILPHFRVIKFFSHSDSLLYKYDRVPSIYIFALHNFWCCSV